ncbi:MAG: carboxypeptidase-like regulatory domain-containing protein [Candidatus Brocadiaceae bacterium]|nr:carboxypeptidase-like regulatory domain-containing protein [Candidatus Brocadiaceae bacterium]
MNGDPIESARLRLKEVTMKVVKNTSADADGFFEFTGLGVDTYVIFAKKMRYKKAKATVKLEEEDSKEIEIEMKKTSKRIMMEREK